MSSQKLTESVELELWNVELEKTVNAVLFQKRTNREASRVIEEKLAIWNRKLQKMWFGYLVRSEKALKRKLKENN